MHYLPRWCVFMLDMLLCAIAYVVSITIGSGIFQYDILADPTPLWLRFTIVMLVQTCFFALFHTSANIIRYSTFIDTIKVLLSVLCTGTVLLVINFVSKRLAGSQIFLNTAIIIYFFIAAVLLFCLRVGVKTLFEAISQRATKHENVLIYGTHAAGVAIAKMLRSSDNSRYTPVGFIIDSNDENIRYLQGLKTYQLSEKLIDVMKAKGIKSIIISPKKMKEITPAKDLQLFLEHNIHILITPSFVEWENEKNNSDMSSAHAIGKIENIRVEDLLGRPSIHIDTDNVRQLISNQTVLVTGAAGSIGSELVRQILCFEPHCIVLLDQAESPLHDIVEELHALTPHCQIVAQIADVRNRQRIMDIFKEYAPAIVFHSAAYKHVPLMEDFPCEAVLTNVMGTRNVVDAAIEHGTKRFLMVSTDKAVNPTNVMGATKRIAELYCQSIYQKVHSEHTSDIIITTTRFGNVLGSNGSVIPHFKKQIAAGGPVTVTHPEITRYFMTIPEACNLVMEAITITHGGEIFIFDMGQPVKIADLAQNMIRLAGLEPGKDIKITYTGLRQGEKLYEELLNRQELTMPTVNEKIKIAKVMESEYDVISRQVDELIQSASTGKDFPTVKAMKQIVPEYISKNSIYEKLD